MIDDILPSLAVIAADYQTVVTVTTAPMGSWQLLLKANAKRFNLRIYNSSGAAAGPMIVPGPPPSSSFGGNVGAYPLEWKYKDAPSATIGEFYVSNTGIVNFLIIETLYLR
jgi:hypothetical protein